MWFDRIQDTILESSSIFIVRNMSFLTPGVVCKLFTSLQHHESLSLSTSGSSLQHHESVSLSTTGSSLQHHVSVSLNTTDSFPMLSPKQHRIVGKLPTVNSGDSNHLTNFSGMKNGGSWHR